LEQCHALFVGGYGPSLDLGCIKSLVRELYKEQKHQHFLQGCALDFNLHQQNLITRLYPVFLNLAHGNSIRKPNSLQIVKSILI